MSMRDRNLRLAKLASQVAGSDGPTPESPRSDLGFGGLVAPEPAPEAQVIASTVETHIAPVESQDPEPTETIRVPSADVEIPGPAEIPEELPEEVPEPIPAALPKPILAAALPPATSRPAEVQPAFAPPRRAMANQDPKNSAQAVATVAEALLAGIAPRDEGLGQWLAVQVDGRLFEFLNNRVDQRRVEGTRDSKERGRGTMLQQGIRYPLQEAEALMRARDILAQRKAKFGAKSIPVYVPRELELELNQEIARVNGGHNRISPRSLMSIRVLFWAINEGFEFNA